MKRSTITTTRPETYYPSGRGVDRERGKRLHTIRDVTAIVRDVLLIVVLAALLLFGWSALRAVGDSATVDNSPKTVTECQDKPADAVWPDCDRYK